METPALKGTQYLTTITFIHPEMMGDGGNQDWGELREAVQGLFECANERGFDVYDASTTLAPEDRPMIERHWGGTAPWANQNARERNLIETEALVGGKTGSGRQGRGF